MPTWCGASGRSWTPTRGCVAEGRDITTVVYPDADLRILLTAWPEARLRRRAGDMAGKLTEDQLRNKVLRRDRDDSNWWTSQTRRRRRPAARHVQHDPGQVVDAITDLAEESAVTEINHPGHHRTPNVGKSQLVTASSAASEAVVQDKPGVADRVS